MHSHSSCLLHTGLSLLVDFDLCAPTRLVFLTLVSICWWTLACALPLVLSFLTLVSRCWCLVFFKLSPTVSSFLQVVTSSVLFSSSCHQQCLVFFKLCMIISCFLQILCDSVLFSSSCHQQCLVSFKLSVTVSCFH